MACRRLRLDAGASPCNSAGPAAASRFRELPAAAETLWDELQTSCGSFAANVAATLILVEKSDEDE
eukprot:CAMPEP_0177220960 /NCGR_PEP_ID=MMETSP0367-20130122/37164_1 /TAXON_ID=447022 ORGANISM="Scrippsiella hangoei-like, Strain SHHI-4" /NCGR_SAMPLE_ID=MMETSP0367 /ASSEMBLY_ACC=CAM_ASM_000362 /LENGTH=65 /DNA_ID=CAMNT_0018670767 /DNA_START=384 /DNA_END=581 /DNA_ORIENTATION=+